MPTENSLTTNSWQGGAERGGEAHETSFEVRLRIILPELKAGGARWGRQFHLLTVSIQLDFDSLSPIGT